MSRKSKLTTIFLILIFAFVGIYFAMPYFSNLGFQLIFPFDWIAASILGPGPFFSVVYLTIGLQTLIYASFLGNAWLKDCFWKIFFRLIVVHILAVLIVVIFLSR